MLLFVATALVALTMVLATTSATWANNGNHYGQIKNGGGCGGACEPA
jgi:hypothetical protein